MNLSQEIVQHLVKIQYDDLPEEVVEVTKKSILDTIGVILAANTLGEGCQAFANVAIAEGGREQSSILGFGQKVSASSAAFVNGAMAHSMDFGESHDTAFVHSSSPTVPAALAIAEMLENVNGKDLITAVALGNDLVCRMGLSLTKNLLEYGWYVPPILGAFGATAAAGKLLNLTEKQMLDAFSLLLCQATCSAEITQNPQTLIRSVRDAFAAKAGVTSALLAKEGVTGFERPFDGKRGFFYAFSRDHYDPELLVSDLGKNFEGANVSFKPWPSCRGTHPYIECVLKIMGEHHLQVDDIEEIKAVVGPVNQTLICEPIEGKRKPENAINAKFSLPFAIATAMVYGNVSLEHYSAEAIQNAEVLAVAQKFQYEVNENLAMKDTLKGYLEIRTKDQNVYFERVDVPFGHPNHPMTNEELTKKFINCSHYSRNSILPEDLNSVIEQILNLENIEEIRDVTRFM
ncbi:MmgE/PrpD family protein [Neobacillus sp. 3P2-tot-E-2]|uniref:MmgE/PrpD family protein n=1 Tax=Neobacillus sp. 3P2-tot-E-2 TaxID=3132212 RepID=UPI0039A21043